MSERRQDEMPIYRFVLYGRAKSGKTCYLAALAMARELNPKGYTCDWLNTATHCPKPAGPEETWDIADAEVARYRGREWLQTGITALENRAVPPANPNESHPYRYHYEFRGPVDAPGAPGLSRTFAVELIDYSGELIDPEISETKLARKVREHMNEADGLLVLAEAPRTRADWSVQHAELLKLRAAFHLVRRPAHGMPIALVINKWDRLGDEYSPEIHEEAVARAGGGPAPEHPVDHFLGHKPEPAHVSLIAALSAKAGEGNFRVFVASALGPCEPFSIGGDAAGERPIQINPLRPYGLEDPFLWLGHRRDELRMAQIGEEAARLHNWTPWQLLTGSHIALDRQSRAAEPFVKPVASWRLALAEAVRKNRVTAAAQAGLIAAAVVLAGVSSALSLTAKADTEHFRAIATSVRTADYPHDPEGLVGYIAKLRDDDRWLTEFHHGSIWRAGSRASIQQDEMLAVLNDLRARMKECEEFETQYRLNASTIDYYRKAIDDLDRTVAAASDMPQLLDARLAVDELAANAEFTTKASVLRPKLDAVKAHLASATNDLEDLKESKRVEQEYNTWVARNDVVGAANLLDGASGGRSTKQIRETLRRDFLSKAEKMLQAAVEGEVNQGSFDAASNVLQSTLRAPAVVKLLGEDNASLLRQRDAVWVWLPQDRALYQAVTDSPTDVTCAAYLEKSHRKEMEEAVRRYKDFLERASRPANYTLTVSRIYFGGGSAKDYHASAEVSVGGILVIATTATTIDPNSWATPFAQADTTLTGVYRGDIETIAASLKATDYRFYSSDLGQAEGRFTLEQLAGGVELPLQTVSQGNKIELKLSGWESTPALPQYGTR